MVDRLVSVDSESLRFPDSVRAKQAADLEDRSTPEGAAVDRVALRAPFEPAGLSDATLAKVEPAGLSEETNAALAARIDAATEPKLDKTVAAQTYGTLSEVRRVGLLQPKKAPDVATPGDLTITFTQTSTTALTTPFEVQGNDRAYLRFSSCGYGAPVSPAGASFMGPRARSASGGDVWGTNVVDYNVNTQDTEYLFQFVQGTKGYVRAWVDDVLVATWGDQAYVADQYWTMRITAPTRRNMHVRVETNMGTRLIRVGQTDSVWLPKKPLYKSRWYFKGDSWIAGAQDPTGRSFIVPLAERLGVEALRGGYSATGYTTNGGGAGGKLSFPDSVVPDILPQSPDLIVVNGSINDSTNVAGVQAAAMLTYQRIADNLPGVPVIVVGPQYGTHDGPSVATCDAMQSAIVAAAAVSPNVVGVISTKGWITGNGKELTPSTTTPKGNSEIVLAPDGIHPTKAGHNWWAERLYGEITALLADLPLTTSAV